MSDLSQTAQTIFLKKYAKKLKSGKYEEWEQCAARVGTYVARAEEREVDYLEYSADFTKIIADRVFIPGGRVLANAGTGIRNLMNCFSMPLEDTRQSIYTTLRNAAEIFAWGGGVGYNASHLREKGAPVKTTSGLASGPVSFLELFDTTGEVISQASRRGAQLAILSCDHPDIKSFITHKHSLNEKNKRIYDEFCSMCKDKKAQEIVKRVLAENQLTHFNISVGITNSFMNAVTNKTMWDLISRADRPIEVISAVELFDLIAKNAWTNGDPGLLFLDTVEEFNLVPYLGKLEGTNPCLHKDTLMHTPHGMVKISDKNKCFRTWKTGEKETIKLITNAGYELILTPDHKIMLDTGEFEEAKNTLNKTLKWDVGNLKTDIISLNAIVLGFLFGDGFLCGNKQGVSVKLNKEKEHEIYKVLTEFGFKEEPSGALYANKKEIEYILGHNVDFLAQRVWEREIPNDILFGTHINLCSFLMGLFEANGSVNIVGQISLKATCKNTVKVAQNVLSMFGVRSWISINKPALVHWKNGDYTSKESYNLQIAPRNGSIFQNNIGFYSNTKKNKIKKFLKGYVGKLKVIAIESCGIHEVWDFNVENHYSLANGIVTHNCSEIPLLPNEACVLGSINLASFVEDTYIDYQYLKDIVRYAVRFLDNVQTISTTPVVEINKATKLTRRLGLGVMGFADLLAEMNIPYNHKEALDVAENIAKFIQKTAWEYSMQLADEKGAFPAFDAEKINWKLIDGLNLPHKPLRNVAVTALAPTGTISLIADVNSSIEPFFAKKYTRNVTSGIGNVAETSLDSDIKYNNILTAHDIDWKDHINMQAMWQKYIDGAVSKTINMHENATIGDVKNAYFYAWEKGCKGTTIYRDRSRNFQILNTT